MVTFLLITVCLTGQIIDMDQFHGMKPRNIGPAGMSGRVTAIAVDANNSGIFYVGTASGGLWKTTSGGITFEPIFDDQKVSSIGALAIDPLRPDIIWAGTGEGNPRNSVTGGFGLYKSLDGGKTWKLAGLENSRHIHRILVNPNNSDIVYVGAIGSPWAPNKERGVYKTTDGGKTWKQILYTTESAGVADMVMDPANPDKIFVAMWDHQRWPWFFNSGGEGSGIYLTLDGGDNFTRLAKGLPDKIGRAGLAIARSNNSVVYAHVESETNAIYRSNDGGISWEKRGEENIGNRPFYYSEIYVDPSNENRVFTLFSGINVSEDGALTFPKSIARTVHLDHHAWWINPENPKHMIDGNDGGLAITYDQGETWQHITNLPVGQFYHVAVDMEKPYNVYGGLQDNGSWRGPAYAWTNDGLINEFWDFLIGGDGFDALPLPGDPRYCYAQSQGGALRRIDLLTGEGKSIRPQIEGGTRLRFNWNTAIAQDPFDNNTIYFGSQFVHKSTTRGDSWQIISPDLTTNDSEKQKQRQSGGLTIDATGAENHCTILAITPSKLQEDLLWAGTDDGNIQITTDGGSTWTNVTGNIKEMPPKSWVAQIKASDFNAGEAFAVVNNYRQGDYSAYLFQTTNFGMTWKQIVDDNDVWGYILSFVQDPVEPDLMFLGTEYGLYVSFDGSKTWNKWTNQFPTVSTYDLVIHPREHDLVIATFGRSIWILDDIRPLRKLAQVGTGLLEQETVLFDPPSGVMAITKNLPGYYYRGDGMFMGENRQIEATITIYAKEKKDDKINLTISDDKGVVLRNLEFEYKEGFNRVSWRFDMDPPELPGMIRNQQQRPQGRNMFRRRGASVLPGKYTVTASLNGTTSTVEIEVESDPRLPEPNVNAVRMNMERANQIQEDVKRYNSKYEGFLGVRNKLTKMNDLITSDMDFAEEHKKVYSAVNDEFNRLNRLFTNRFDGLGSRMFGLNVLYSATDKLTEGEERSVEDALKAMGEAEKMIDDFMNDHWVKYVDFFKEKNITLDRLVKQ
ncbi:MAG TPA: hypothetical protein VMW76_05070 [Bacteroidales bacterium]|nr:hypothetical protein [Bacteroidales bacterium]